MAEGEGASGSDYYHNSLYQDGHDADRSNGAGPHHSQVKVP